MEKRDMQRAANLHGPQSADKPRKCENCPDKEVASTPSNGQRKKVASCRRIGTATGGFLYDTKVHKGGAIG